MGKGRDMEADMVLWWRWDVGDALGKKNISDCYTQKGKRCLRRISVIRLYK